MCSTVLLADYGMRMPERVTLSLTGIRSGRVTRHSETELRRTRSDSILSLIGDVALKDGKPVVVAPFAPSFRLTPTTHPEQAIGEGLPISDRLQCRSAR